jgi:5-methylthioadenosine/S-adenosylhomocysteine deaminase
LTVYEADWVCPSTSDPVRNGAIAVEHGAIVAVGPRESITGEPRVRYRGCALIPGFVNAHTHLELTIFHTLLDGLPFADWIAKLVRIKYGLLSADAIRASARLGAIEMLKSGVTTVGEVMDTGAGWQAMQEFGLQGVAYQEVFGPDESAMPGAMKGLRERIASYRAQETRTHRIGVSPHAPYTVSRALYDAVRDFAQSEQLRMTTHIAESADETLFVREGAGPFAEAHRARSIAVTPRRCLPVAYLDRLKLLSPEMLLIHVIETDDNDLRRIRDSGAFVVHCPRSNAKLGHNVAAIGRMKGLGIPVALGTDSLGSNDAIDMFEEMRLVSKQQSLLPHEVFRMATIDGARALGLSYFVGSLETGKRADFSVIEFPSDVHDPVTFLVNTASCSDVRAVFLEGAPVQLSRPDLVEEVSRVRSTIS